MSQKLVGKVAVVTGASKGIGVAIAKHLAAAGATVAVNYSSSREGADQVAAAILTAGGRSCVLKNGRADCAHKAETAATCPSPKSPWSRRAV